MGFERTVGVGRSGLGQRVLSGLAVLLVGVAWSGATPVWGQVSIFLKPGAASRGTVRGEISGMSPDRLTVKADSGDIEVDVHSIRSITYSQAPAELARAKSRFEAMQFDEGLEELAKVATPVASKDLEHELDWLQAMATAESALQGGKVTAQDAGKVLTAFLRKYPNSFYTWPVTERLGKLLTAIGRSDLAQTEFAKLAGSTSPEYQLKGSFYVSQSRLSSGDGPGALESLKVVTGSALEGEGINELKSRAKAMNARALALSGDLAAAKQAVEKLVAEENPENAALFAEAYNTLGFCHYQEGDMKAAALAFLHTDLLFFTQTESHAEALWYLSQIWPKLDKPDAGFQAQETLRRLYRTSPWASKPGQRP